MTKKRAAKTKVPLASESTVTTTDSNTTQTFLKQNLKNYLILLPDTPVQCVRKYSFQCCFS